MPENQPMATWTSRESASPAPVGALRAALHELALDRATPVRELVLETCSILRAWVHERPADWTWEAASTELDDGVGPWIEGQAWRGPAARLVATLRRACDAARPGGPAPRDVLSEELGLWLSDDDVEQDVGAPTRWSEQPLDPGRRLPDRAEAARHAVEGAGTESALGRGESLLALGGSEVLARALVLAHERGLEPRVLTGLGGPCAEGLLLARRLRSAGVAVRVGWDVALAGRLDEFDRIWIGTEALGGGRFLALAGTELLLRRARELGVPAELLITSDQHLPDGAEARPPAWCARDGWLLWEDAPAGVELEAQAYEPVALDLVRCIVTEAGRLAPRALARDELLPTGSPGPAQHGASDAVRSRPTPLSPIR